jgi:hypothetical protein
MNYLNEWKRKLALNSLSSHEWRWLIIAIIITNYDNASPEEAHKKLESAHVGSGF